MTKRMRRTHSATFKAKVAFWLSWGDNVFVERLWKSVKYERVYSHAYDSVTIARASIMQYMDWYNRARPHSSLAKKAPDEAYAVMLPKVKLAA